MKNVKIEEVEQFTLKLKNALSASGINQLDDLRRLSRRDLYYLSGIGAKGRNTVIDFCRQNEIKFSERSGLQRRINELTGGVLLSL